MKQLLEKFKELMNILNAKGIPLPMLRDPNTGRASLTATMTFVSFNTALLGQMGKIAGFLGGIDLSQANYLFLMCLGAYLGRRMQGSKENPTLDAEQK